MYRSFYNLNYKPFHTSSDPRFLWLGEKHKEALATLKYGILDNKGFLLLTGDVGTGKTTLINTLVNSLGKDVLVATVLDPGLSRLDFFNYIAHAFGMDEVFTSKGQFLVNFSDFLHKSNEDSKKVLLIIDESQRLDGELLEEIRLLSNIEKQNSKLLNIFFVGQNEFNDMLHDPDNRAVRQRLTLNYNLDPLSRAETESYITYRLLIAGTKEKIFTSKAIDEIFSYTHGFPRQINIVCDLALLSGYVSEKVVIDADVIRDCAGDLKIPEKNANIPSAVGDQAGIHKTADSMNVGGKSEGSWRIKKPIFILLLLILIFLVGFVLFPHPRQDMELLFSSDQANTVVENGVNTEAKEKTDERLITVTSPFAVPVSSPKVQGSSPINEQEILDKVVKQVQRKSQQEPTVHLTQVILPVENSIESDVVGKSNVDVDDMKVDTDKALDDETTEIKVISEPSTDFATKDTESVNPEAEFVEVVTDVVAEPVTVLPVTIPKKTLLIWFSLNSTDMNNDQIDALSEFTRVLIRDKSSKIIITGYSDTKGNASYNLKISEFRANIVKSYFIGAGVLPAQLKARGLGIRNPVASNETIEGREANRRVEIVFDTTPTP